MASATPEPPGSGGSPTSSIAQSVESNNGQSNNANDIRRSISHSPLPGSPGISRQRLASARNPSISSLERMRSSSRASSHQKPKSPTGCPNQDCEQFDPDEIEGRKICATCGTLISESNIVNEVTFAEGKDGAAQLQGGYVGEGQRHANTMGSAFRRLGGHMESRQFAELFARREIQRQAHVLAIPEPIADQASLIYKLAINNQFTRGRRIRVVAAMALYVACRRDSHSTVLLMDFSDILHVNVFKLGECYKAMKKELYLDSYDKAGIRPVIDVEDLIMNYAKKLEFGQAVVQVASDAATIVKRMKRDWMVTGRQPSGLCGACIILAARMNNFRRSVREVVYVVKVADLTIYKRLEEFQRTEASELSIDDFRENGLKLKGQADPPAIYMRQEREEMMRRKKRKLDRMMSGDTQNSPGVISEDSSTPESREGSIVSSKRPRIDKDGFKIPDIPVDPKLTGDAQTSERQAIDRASQSPSAASDTRAGSARIGSATPELSSGQQKRKRGRPRKSDASRASSVATEATMTPTPTSTPTPEPSTNGDRGAPSLKSKRGLPKGSKNERKLPRVVTETDLIAEHELEDEMETILKDPEFISKMEEAKFNEFANKAKQLADAQIALERSMKQGGAAAQGQKRTADEASLDADDGSSTAESSDTVGAHSAKRARQTTPELPYLEEGNSYTLPEQAETISESEFADDPEVTNCLLSEPERRMKERIWVTHNEGWLREQQAKHLKKVMDEANPPTWKKTTKRGKRPRMGDGSLLAGREPPKDAAEATKIMLEKHAPSSSIDYEKLKKIYNSFGQKPPNSEGGSGDGSSAAGEGGKGVRTSQADERSERDESVAGETDGGAQETERDESVAASDFSGASTAGPSRTREKRREQRSAQEQQLEEEEEWNESDGPEPTEEQLLYGVNGRPPSDDDELDTLANDYYNEEDEMGYGSEDAGW